MHATCRSAALVHIGEIAYNYAPDGLVSIDDTDAAGMMSTTTFQYDNRNRLTDEARTGQTPYDLSYTYDPGGNRLSKTDNLTGWIITYNYDINDSSDGGQHNNRLFSYAISDGGQAVEQASYHYGADGNVARLIRWFPIHPTQSRGYSFSYDTSDHLWMAVDVSDAGGISANLAITESNEDTVTFLSFCATRQVNSSLFTNSTTTINWANLPDGTYTYNATVNDTSGNSNSTTNRTITLLSSCLDQDTCTENSDCNITTACVLHSGLCTNSICNFNDLRIDATVRTLYDSSGNGRDLALNASNITFLQDNTNIVFRGKNGTSLGGGSAGGAGGVMNITVPWLFNTTNAQFLGFGGYSTSSGSLGGAGGVLQLNYHGLILNFTDERSGGFPTPAHNDPVVSAGDSIDAEFGVDGVLIYNQDSKIPRDVDINGDGEVDAGDGRLITDYYNNQTGDSTFSIYADIDDDGKLNVLDLFRVGFEYDTR